jgi:dinuclear metal center YbgI/SA1388 family protein
VTQRDEILAALDRAFEPALVPDWCPNGLQVEGAEEVQHIVTGVTASEALLKEAVRRGAQMVLVHHGIFWDGASRVLRGSLLKRVRVCLEGRLNLVAYHLPMDRQQEIGNNAPALKEMGATELEPFAAVKGVKIGWKGRFREPIGFAELQRRIQALYGQRITVFQHGPAQVRTLGLVSGAGQGDVVHAAAEKLDAFITGEISEYSMHLAREEGLHHFSVGHHASERMGPMCTAAWLARQFPVQAEFVDLPNPA